MHGPHNNETFHFVVWSSAASGSGLAAYTAWTFIEIVNDECETECIEITREDIETSYEKQWRYIIKNGPSNTYDQAASLQAVLQS